MHDLTFERNVRTGIVELRQYTLHPGMRDTLVELFDAHFVESQEACGMSVIGQFRDMDRPDRFVWLRGFDSMATRPAALGAFYDGPVWTRHREAANATMIDSDDVRLLKPAWTGTGFAQDAYPQPHVPKDEAGVIQAGIFRLAEAGATAFPAFFRRKLQPALVGAGANMLAAFVTEPAANNYPRLPVRGGGAVFVWFARFAGVDAERQHRSELALSVAWLDAMADARDHIRGPLELLRLAPTRRSLLR